MQQTKIHVTREGFDLSIFEIREGFVNLTKLARSQGKDVKLWKRLKSTQSFLDALQRQENSGVQILHSRENQGGELGTFGTREVAIKLAQWISPDFEVFCMKKLDELLLTGKTQLNDNNLIDYYSQLSEVDQAIMYFQEVKRKKELEANYEAQRPKAEYFDQIVERNHLTNLRDTAKLLGITQNNFINWLLVENYLYRTVNRELRAYSNETLDKYFSMREFTRNNHGGSQVMITPLGRSHFLQKMKQNGNILLLR